AYYPFNGNANDESGNGNNGAVNGATLVADRKGTANKAYSFDGVDDQIHAQSTTGLPAGNSDRTWSVWFKTPWSQATGKNACILAMGTNGSTNQCLGLGMQQTGVLFFGIWGSLWATPDTYNDNQWHHAVFIHSSGTAKLYVDGVLKITQPLTLNTNFGDFRIGQTASNNLNEHFPGSIDDVRIYNRALSTAEVSGLYDAEKPSLNDGLLVHYPFNGNANDESGNGRHATVSGSPSVPDRHGTANGAQRFTQIGPLPGFPNGYHIEGGANTKAMGPIKTVSVWYAPDQITNSQMDLVNKRKYGFVSHGWNLSINNQRQLVYQVTRLANPNSDGVVSPNPINLVVNEWVHLVATHEGNDVRLYVNGQQVAQKNVNMDPREGYSWNGLMVGAGLSQWAGTVPVNNVQGDLDDVRVYNRALGATEISELHRQEAPVGSLLWTYTTGSWLNSGPSIGDNGYLFIVSNDGKLYALNPATGTKVWDFPGDGGVKGTPAVGSNGAVYVGSGSGKLYSLNALTGAENWAFNAGAWVQTSPAIAADGTVYAGASNGVNKVYAINGSTGAQIWEFQAGGELHGGISIGTNGYVYFGCNDNKVYAVNGATGTEVWSYNTTGHVRGANTPAIASDGTVYVGSDSGKLYSLNGTTGAENWAFNAGAWLRGSPVIGTDGTIYFATANTSTLAANKLYAVNGATGAELWNFPMTSYVNAPPVIGSDGTIYIGEDPGGSKKFYAVNGATGAKLWDFTTAGGISMPATIGSNGVVYFGSVDGKVYAIKGNSSTGLASSPWPSHRRNLKGTGRQ
ncbi:MAG: hypothetical protein CMJ70_01110, partial [Planctomycetaceae bacterium]|nr:hypothetical protein [Planctomycetaceae bacterium]